MRTTAIFTAIAIAATGPSLAAVPSGGHLVAQNGAPAQQLSLEARQLQGAEAITVSGTAPAGATVTITMTALISEDLPTVLVSRHDIVTDVTGHFGGVIPIASAFDRGIRLQVIATAPGESGAQAQLVTEAPNAGASVPFEH